MGLYRTSAARRHFSRVALAAMAFPAAAPAFQRAAPAGAQFRSFDSWIRDCSASDVADPARDRDVGTRSTSWSIELAACTEMAGARRHVSAHGLCLLVVALGQSHGPAILAVP